MSIATDTLYDFLSVAPDADEAAIRRACRQAARKWSPDYNTSPEAHQQMVRVNDARATLLDPRKRQTYNRSIGITSKAQPETPSQREPIRTVRVVPATTSAGEVTVGSSRIVEIDVYLDGPEPESLAVEPHLGDGWIVEEAGHPDADTGPYLSVRINLNPPADAPVGPRSESIDISFDDDSVRAVFTWTVVPEPAAVPKAPPAPSPPRAAPAAPPRAAPAAPTVVPLLVHATTAPTGGLTGPAPKGAPEPLDAPPPLRPLLLLAIWSFVVWVLTPIAASLADPFVPGLRSAVWAAGENAAGRGGPPISLYQHLGQTIVAFDIAVVVLTLALRIRLRVRWPIIVGIVSGLVLFAWLVLHEGGRPWHWDVLPATTFVGYLAALLLSGLPRAPARR